MLEHHPTISEGTHSRSGLDEHQSPTEVSPPPGGPLHSSPSIVVAPSPCSQSALGQSLPLTCQQESRLNYSRRVHTWCPVQVAGGAVPLAPTGHILHKVTLTTVEILDPTEHLLHEATLLRSGNTASLSNTKQTQEDN